MRKDIISELAELGELSHVFVLTHNIDFVFIQTVLLSSLAKCGHPKMTVIADAHCADETYEAQFPVISGLGTRYRLCAPAVPQGFRFHPKAVLAIGKANSALFVGSGNLTFGGFRENFEVWSRFDASAETKAVFGSFRAFLRMVAEQVGDREQIYEDLAAALNPRKLDWAADLPTDGPLHHSMSGHRSLLTQFQEEVDSASVNRIVVSTPYFDETTQALHQFAQSYSPIPIIVRIQDRRSTLFSEAAASLPNNVSLERIVPTGTNDGAIGRFIHAKFFAFERDENVVVFSGSANCSIAALIRGDGSGNVELMCRHHLPYNEYNDLYLHEFKIREGLPELLASSELEEESTDAEEVFIRILNANFEDQRVLVRFAASVGTTIISCLIDGNERKSFQEDDDILFVDVESPPRRIQLSAKLGNRYFTSNNCWINDEEALRATATRRNIGDIINSANRSGFWNLNDWSIILGRLTDEFTETGRQYIDRQQTSKNEGEHKSLRFTREDVFSASYAIHHSARAPLGSGNFDTSTSVLGMLLHSFGIDVEREEQSDITDDADLDLDIDNDDQDSNDVVDRPKPVSAKIRIDNADTEPRPKDLKKIAGLVDTIATQISKDSFVLERSPRRLREDLEIVAILLRLVLSKGWLERGQFLDSTHLIFANLLLADESGNSGGLLTQRYQESENPTGFASAFCSTQLSGALLAWAIAGFDETSNLRQLRFRFAQWISAGRMPWLWQGGDHAEILQVVATLLLQTPCSARESALTLADIEAYRIELLQKGQALYALEDALERETRSAVQDLIVPVTLQVGDLLWQGRRGFCLVQSFSGDSDVNVYCINDANSDATFREEYVLPIRAILQSPDALERLGLLKKIVDTLQQIISEFTGASVSD